MNEREKELLDIYERFGDDAQNAMDFMRRNTSDNSPMLPISEESPKIILPNGVYIVYPDGHYELFSRKLTKKEDGMRVGICWDGHTWCIGTDYGDTEWTKASEDELGACRFGIMNEYEAILDWNAELSNTMLRDFWKHIPFKDDEMMPTCPMVLVQERLAKTSILNDALEFVGMPPYETGVSRWFAERYGVNGARIFYGSDGYLGYHDVDGALRTQAVTLWNI